MKENKKTTVLELCQQTPFWFNLIEVYEPTNGCTDKKFFCLVEGFETIKELIDVCPELAKQEIDEYDIYEVEDYHKNIDVCNSELQPNTKILVIFLKNYYCY